MKTIDANGYSISFNSNGYQALQLLLENTAYSKIFVLTDSHTNELCLPHFLPLLATEIPIEIIEFDAGEVSKNIETCVEIWNVLTELGADRKSLLLNVGGGVVTDMGGFVAATFKRGIAFINIPTTLLAMVDASIGGKTGIDLGNLKNQIGVFAIPKMVLIDTAFLETLPRNEMISGLAEMLKHGLICDKIYWEHFLDLSKLDFADFDALIYSSIEIKNNLVLQDPKEQGMRKALNFGHTLGHAIESYFLDSESKTTLLHGEAIAVGMVLESFCSLHLNLLSKAAFLEIKTTILGIFGKIAFDANDIDSILKLLIHDKKNEYGTIQFALLNGIGNTKINQKVESELIKMAFSDYKS